MQKSADAWEDGGQTSVEADSMQLHPLIGTVTSFDGHSGYINQSTFFPRSSLWEGTVLTLHRVFPAFLGPWCCSPVGRRVQSSGVRGFPPQEKFKLFN